MLTWRICFCIFWRLHSSFVRRCWGMYCRPTVTHTLTVCQYYMMRLIYILLFLHGKYIETIMWALNFNACLLTGNEPKWAVPFFFDWSFVSTQRQVGECPDERGDADSDDCGYLERGSLPPIHSFSPFYSYSRKALLVLHYWLTALALLFNISLLQTESFFFLANFPQVNCQSSA